MPPKRQRGSYDLIERERHRRIIVADPALFGSAQTQPQARRNLSAQLATLALGGKKARVRQAAPADGLVLQPNRHLGLPVLGTHLRGALCYFQDPSKLLMPSCRPVQGNDNPWGIPDLSLRACRRAPQSRQPPPSALAIAVPLASLRAA